jgi:hypothetical protein
MLTLNDQKSVADDQIDQDMSALSASSNSKQPSRRSTIGRSIVLEIGGREAGPNYADRGTSPHLAAMQCQQQRDRSDPTVLCARSQPRASNGSR